jgi:phosphoribosylformimino-5-aminoimidazole carboxamide ribotide isomerase
MKFRPCIDLHNGQVKQIVGSTLTDIAASSSSSSSSSSTPTAVLNTNFETDRPASDFAIMYKNDKLTGGHVIMLGPGNKDAAQNALQAYPNKLQVGGGINDTNALEWLDDAKASHVIVTSYVFSNGQIHMEKLKKLVEICGKERLVLDLSCRKRPKYNEDDDNDDSYYVVTDRWQNFTNYKVTPENLIELAQYCDEFLVHGVDVEGKQCGILEDLVELLGEHSPIPVTYAGGVRSIDDLESVKKLGKDRVDATVGSALDCFGGKLKYDDVVTWHTEQN